MNPTFVLFGAVSLFSLAAAYTDLRSGLIPNRLILFGLSAAVLVHAWTTLQIADPSGASAVFEVGKRLIHALGGLLVCALTPLLLFRLRAMGGGDVKLLAVLGAFVGPVMGMEIQVNAFIVMSVFAAARFAYRGQLLDLVARASAFALNPLRPSARRRPVPAELLLKTRFAPAVFVAAVLVVGVRFIDIPSIAR